MLLFALSLIAQRFDPPSYLVTFAIVPSIVHCALFPAAAHRHRFPAKDQLQFPVFSFPTSRSGLSQAIFIFSLV